MLFHEWFSELPPFVSTLIGIFTLWMLIDAYRRQADRYWVWIIIFAPGLGALAYFVTVKFPELHRGGSLPWFGPRPPSLVELRYQAEQVPTLASQLALGERLVELKMYSEAAPHLEKALDREPDHCRVLYLLALCRAGEGDSKAAVTLLRKVVGRDRAWSDYEGWRTLVRIQAEAGETASALADCRELVRTNPTLQHTCMLAQRLMAENQAQEACRSLEQALQAYRFAPAPIRRRNGRWVREAKRLIRDTGVRS
jgi:hypothetical protein